MEKNIFGVKIMAVIAGTLILAMTACSTSSDQGKKEAASADSAAETVDVENRELDTSELVFERSGDSVKLTSGDESLTITLKATKGAFDAASGEDVTDWFVTQSGNAVFTNSGVAIVESVNENGTSMEITLDASAIQGFTAGGTVAMYVQPEKQAAKVNVGSYTIPELDITLDASEGVVAANTSGAAAVTGAVAYFNLTMPEETVIDDVNTEAVTLAMTAGDGYCVDEFTDPVVRLDEAVWSEGRYEFHFDETEVEKLFTRTKVRGSESEVYSEGGPDWTAFGGNGNGQYYFNLTVSGLTYQGLPVPDSTFRVCYYVYGRDASDKARITLADYINVYDYEDTGAEKRTLAETGRNAGTGNGIAWTWIGADYEGKPILCDTEQDDFYITWPEGVDASALTASDVTVTLYSQYGDEQRLVPDSEYYVYSDSRETQIAVPYVQMAFTPVYTNMVISVDRAAVSGADDAAEEAFTQSYDIASVYVYQVQHGGLNPNGAVLVYQFYGFDEDTLTDWSQLMHGFEYALYIENEDGTKAYYSEENGGCLVDSADAAALYDAAGAQDLNIRLWDQAVIYDTTSVIENEDGSKTYRTETKTVNGENITFNKIILTGWDGNDLRGVQMMPAEARANGLKPAAGYAFPQTDDFYEKFKNYNFGHDYWVAHSMWPWVEGIERGWLTNADDMHASWNGLDKGYHFEYGSDGRYPDWSAPEAEGSDNWWPWLRDGFPDGMWEAVDAANADTYRQ